MRTLLTILLVLGSCTAPALADLKSALARLADDSYGETAKAIEEIVASNAANAADPVAQKQFRQKFAECRTFVA